jgi:alpha-maltose-1-phosphate synthase
MKIGYLMQAGVPDLRQNPFSGPAMHVRCVIEELHKLGHQVRLLAFMDGEVWRSDKLDDFERISIRWLDKGPIRIFESAVRRIQSELGLPYAAMFESLRFAQACRQAFSGYDILYERLGWVGYGGTLAAAWLKIPLVLEVNGDHLSELEMLGMKPQGLQRQLSINLMNRVSKKASHVVATGEGWRQRFIERWGVSPDKVTVIENGSIILNLVNKDQLRAYSIPDPSEAITIIYVGAFEPWHGLTVLVQAVAEAIHKGVLLKLILVGSGTCVHTIEQMIHELRIEDQVVLPGYLSPQQFATYLAGADIGVSPYCGRVEYSGLKLLDYKAAGLAVIASGENGQPAVLAHDSTGWIVPPCDENALREAIVQLATNAGLRQKIGRQARVEAESIHSWRHTAKQLEELFIRLTDS